MKCNLSKCLINKCFSKKENEYDQNMTEITDFSASAPTFVNRYGSVSRQTDVDVRTITVIRVAKVRTPSPCFHW